MSYMDVIDTLILLLLMGWAWMDRTGRYFTKEKP